MAGRGKRGYNVTTLIFKGCNFFCLEAKKETSGMPLGRTPNIAKKMLGRKATGNASLADQIVIRLSPGYPAAQMGVQLGAQNLP